jgi:hypothetical protein
MSEKELLRGILSDIQGALVKIQTRSAPAQSASFLPFLDDLHAH